MKKLNIKEIIDRNSSLINELLEVWEDSVKATHLFLSNEEINSIKKYVPQAILGVSHLIIMENENLQPIAFMGINDTKLEMLFVGLSLKLKKGTRYCDIFPSQV